MPEEPPVTEARMVLLETLVWPVWTVCPAHQAPPDPSAPTVPPECPDSREPRERPDHPDPRDHRDPRALVETMAALASLVRLADLAPMDVLAALASRDQWVTPAALDPQDSPDPQDQLVWLAALVTGESRVPVATPACQDTRDPWETRGHLDLLERWDDQVCLDLLDLGERGEDRDLMDQWDPREIEVCQDPEATPVMLEPLAPREPPVLTGREDLAENPAAMVRPADPEPPDPPASRVCQAPLDLMGNLVPLDLLVLLAMMVAQARWDPLEHQGPQDCREHRDPSEREVPLVKKVFPEHPDRGDLPEMSDLTEKGD